MTREQTPSLSVVVTAYQRKSFLIQAVESVLSQSLNRTFYEIIVVKSFSDVDIDNYLSKNLVKSVLQPQNSSMGDDIVAGLKVATGDVICFLDDDDIFENSKLETIMHEFEADPKLDYFHNNYTIVNEQLLPTASINYFRTSDRLFVDTSQLRIEGALQIYKSAGSAISSCISIRRRVLDRIMQHLSGLTHNPDSVFFFSALSSNGHLVIDPRALTRYRVHESTIHPKGDFRSIQETMITRAEGHEKSWRIIRSIVLSGENSSKGIIIASMPIFRLKDDITYLVLKGGGRSGMVSLFYQGFYWFAHVKSFFLVEMMLIASVFILYPSLSLRVYTHSLRFFA